MHYVQYAKVCEHKQSLDSNLIVCVMNKVAINYKQQNNLK